MFEALRASADTCVAQAIVRADSVAPAPSGSFASQSVKAVEAVYGHVVDVLGSGDRVTVPIPILVLAQARLAAVSNLALDVLLRRCVAVNDQIGLHLTEVVSQIDMSREGRVDVARKQVQIADRLIEAVVEEYNRAEPNGGSTVKQRLALVTAILEGQPLDAKGLGYDLNRHHVAVFAEGVEDGPLKRVATELSADTLLVHPGTFVQWMWMGTVEELRSDALRLAVKKALPARCIVAFGATESGRAGWRESHMQARHAYGVARRTGIPTHYEDVTLVASTVCDHVLESFLRRKFLKPLKDPPRGGMDLLQTLRAYFAADRNGSSAAAALDVSRQTVSNRLQFVEHRLGRNLSSCAPEVELALRLDELDRSELYRSAERRSPASL